MYIEIDNEKRMEFQSDLRPIMKILEKKVTELDWLISYHEFQYLNKTDFDERLRPLEPLIRLTGKELVEATINSQIQFNWGVLSGQRGLPKIEDLDLDKLQLKNYDRSAYVYDDAELEIDCFDSSSTVIRSRDMNIMCLLSEYFEVEIKN
jgi:hypothetical protein